VVAAAAAVGSSSSAAACRGASGGGAVGAAAAVAQQDGPGTVGVGVDNSAAAAADRDGGSEAPFVDCDVAVGGGFSLMMQPRADGQAATLDHVRRPPDAVGGGCVVEGGPVASIGRRIPVHELIVIGSLAAKHLAENVLELVAEDAVDDKVDGGVESDQGVGDVVHDLDLDGHDLEHVADQGQDVADEEDDDDVHQHGGQPDLLALDPGQLGSSLVGPLDLVVDQQVEGCQAEEGDEVHDDQVEPGDVDADVGRVLSHGSHDDVGDVEPAVVLVLRFHLPEPGQVVEKGEDGQSDDQAPGLAEGAQRPRLEGQADGHVALQGDGHGQVDAARLSNHGHREGVGGDGGKHVEEVVLKNLKKKRLHFFSARRKNWPK